MTYTRYDLRSLVRRRLGDLTSPFTWSDLQLNQWLNDAIADYSLHFPRRLEASLDCSEGEQAYSLPDGCLEMLNVEYPAGNDPPAYLQRGDHRQAAFQRSQDLSDILASGSALSSGSLLLSAVPVSGESITLAYQGLHPYLEDDSEDPGSGPEEHLELLVLYVRQAVLQELALTAAAASSVSEPGSGLLRQA